MKKNLNILKPIDSTWIKENVSNYESDPSPLDFSITYSFGSFDSYHIETIRTNWAAFFKVLCKAALFGISNKGLEQQVTCVINEAVDCYKGSNVVITYLPKNGKTSRFAGR